MALGVSVGWLIEQRQLGLVVLAGASELDRRIEWVHSIELADPTPWLRGGELLLTTGLHLPADDRFAQTPICLDQHGAAPNSVWIDGEQHPGHICRH